MRRAYKTAGRVCGAGGGTRIGALLKPLDPISVFNAVSSNAATYLTTPTYEGSGQATHPDVVYIPSGWNGYKYWMAMTPYPASNDVYENPSIIASNDGETWVVPNGLTNPIDTPTSGHNSDTEILFYGGKLWVYWRLSDGINDKIYVSNSSNGTTWTAKNEILSGNNTELLSPTIIEDDDTLIMWVVDDSTSSGIITKYTSNTPDGTWTKITSCTLVGENPSEKPWHINVVKYGNEYHMLLQMNVSLYFAVSNNTIDWRTTNDALIAPSASGWDDSVVYRGTLVLKRTALKNYYECFYSAQSSSNVWRIGKTTIDIIAHEDDLNYNVLSNYDFEETSGLIIEDNVGSNDGFINTAIIDQISLTNLGKCYKYDNDYSTLVETNKLVKQFGYMSVWVKFHNASIATQRIVMSNNDNAFKLTYTTLPRRFLFEIENTDGAHNSLVQSNITIDADKWYNVIVAWADNEYTKMWVNSILQAENTNPGQLRWNSSDIITLASYQNIAQYAYIYMDQLTFRKKLPSDSEISRLYGNGNGLPKVNW